MAVDLRNCFILTGHVTPANYSDTQEFERLVRSSRMPAKSRVYGDKGFCSLGNREKLMELKLMDGIIEKATLGHKFSAKQKHRNRLISSVRGIVERGFVTLKRYYGLCRAKYLGMFKVEASFLLVPLRSI